MLYSSSKRHLPIQKVIDISQKKSVRQECKIQKIVLNVATTKKINNLTLENTLKMIERG